MIQVDYLVLADAAVVSEGKQYIHGAGWDSLYAASVPVTHPVLGMAVRIRVPWNDTNQPMQLELDIVDADETSIFIDPAARPRATLTAGRPPHLLDGQDQVIPLAFQFLGITFQRFGTYTAIVRINGSDEARSKFYVRTLPGMLGPDAR